MIQAISSKREAFRAEIRAKQINAIMSKVRYQVRKQQRTELINTIIASTEHAIHSQQIRMLIKLGLQGEQNAVIHLGNLMIDGIVTIEMIKQFESQHPTQNILGSGEYYIWLLNVFYEHNYFREEHLLYLIDYITAKIQSAKKNMEVTHLGDSPIFFQHGLCLLKKIIKKHSSAAELIMLETTNERNKKLLRAIYSMCQASLDGRITSVCYSILNIFTMASPNQEVSVVSLVSQSNFMQVLRTGILRRQSNIRCLTYQIINNSIIEQAPIVQMRLLELLTIILNAWRKQKAAVQIQISYLILTIAEKLNADLIMAIVTQFGLVSRIKEMIQDSDIIEVTNNCIRALFALQNMLGGSEDIKIKSQFLFDQNLKDKIMSFCPNQ